MARWFMVLMFLGNVLTVAAQDKPEPPTGQQPEIMLARAVEKDGSVVVSFSSPILQPKRQEIEADVDGKKNAFTRITYEFVKWNEVDLSADGVTVRAFGVDGKEVASRLLPERLKKTTRVAVVLNGPGTEAKLDSYYLKSLREDTVVFTIPLTTFYAP